MPPDSGVAGSGIGPRDRPKELKMNLKKSQNSSDLFTALFDKPILITDRDLSLSQLARRVQPGYCMADRVMMYC